VFSLSNVGSSTTVDFILPILRDFDAIIAIRCHQLNDNILLPRYVVYFKYISTRNDPKVGNFCPDLCSFQCRPPCFEMKMSNVTGTRHVVDLSCTIALYSCITMHGCTYTTRNSAPQQSMAKLSNQNSGRVLRLVRASSRKRRV